MAKVKAKGVDDIFTAIINEAFRQADAIDCPLQDFIDQLNGWKSEIAMRLESAKSDLERQEEEEEEDEDDE